MDGGDDGSRGEWVGGSGGREHGEAGDETKGEAGARGSRWEADDELTGHACVRARTACRKSVWGAGGRRAARQRQAVRGLAGSGWIKWLGQ